MKIAGTWPHGVGVYFKRVYVALTRPRDVPSQPQRVVSNCAGLGKSAVHFGAGPGWTGGMGGRAEVFLMHSLHAIIYLVK